MTETPAANSSHEPSTLDPLAVNTQLAADSPVQGPKPEFSEPQHAEPSERSGELASSAALQAMEGDDEVKEIKSTMLDSAGLANQAASQALKAGAELQHATDNLINLHATQSKLGLIVLASCGTLMVFAMVLFVFISSRLQQRIAQADAMLLAVGKRVVTMNESLELIRGTGEILRDISSNQSAISSQQNKLDGRFDEVLRVTQGAVNSPTKDSKPQDTSKLLQAIELQIQGNSSAIKNLSTQLRSQPAAGFDPAMIRREIEASLLRQQSKTPVPTPAPAAAAAATSVTPVASPVPVKPVERMVQYPRVQSTQTLTP